MSILQKKLETIRTTLKNPTLKRRDQALLLTHSALRATRIDGVAGVTSQVLFQLDAPPPHFRGLRDLLVRRGTLNDIDGIASVNDVPRDLVERRLRAGDLVFVGELEGRLLCHTWFHAPPTPFLEDAQSLTRWALAKGSFWSFDAAAAPDARTSGVFVKVFQSALRELFTDHGASRVQATTSVLNQRSLVMHERLGFRRLGLASAVRVGPVTVVRWLATGATKARHYASRTGELTLTAPPVATDR